VVLQLQALDATDDLPLIRRTADALETHKKEINAVRQRDIRRPE